MAEQLRLWPGDAFEEPPRWHESPADRPDADQPEPTPDASETPAHPPSEPPTLVTSGFIARELGQPRHRVCRILETRADIQPAAYAGGARVFKTRVIARVRHELNAIDARRSARKRHP